MKLRFFFLLSFCLLKFSLNAQSGFLERSVCNVRQFNEHGVVADINQDGYQDYITYTDSSLIAFINDGSARFYEHVLVKNRLGLNGQFEVGDVDNDGDLDFVFVDEYNLGSSYLIGWYENIGNLHFQVHIIDNIPSNAFDVFVKLTDLNQDGNLDFFVKRGDVWWYEGDSNGNFIPHLLNLNTTQFAFVKNIEAKDINNDGELDIVLTGFYTAGRIQAYLNNGMENFSYNPIMSINLGNCRVIASDLDGNGSLDFMSLCRISSAEVVLSWHQNNGSYAFTQNVIDTISAQVDLNEIEFTFFDNGNDGNLDVVFRLPQEGMYAYLDNGSNVYSQSVIQASWIGTTPLYVKIHPIDFDNDGDYDFLTGENILYRDNGGTTYNREIFSPGILRPTDGQVLDFDFDGDLDFALSTHGYLAWIENDGLNNYGFRNITNSHGIVNSIDCADIDGDGDIDVLAAFEDSALIIFENVDNYHFNELNIAFGLYETANAKFGDFDGDGDEDILAVDMENGNLMWFEHTANLNFSSHLINNVSDLGFVLNVVDLDLDGDLDFVTHRVNNLASNFGIDWYVNDGFGNFSEIQLYSSEKTGAIESVDLDQDGDLDLVATGWLNLGHLAWYENDGSQNFTRHIIMGTHSTHASLKIADMDDDGFLDIVYVYNNGSIFYNDGLQNFNRVENITNYNHYGNSITSLTLVGDFDQDGDVDVTYGYDGELGETLLFVENLKYNNYINIKVFPFVDSNLNGIKDTSEVLFEMANMQIQPGNTLHFTTNSYFQVVSTQTGVFNISLIIDSNYWAPTDSLNRIVEAFTPTHNDSVYIGVLPLQEFALQVNAIGMKPRCQDTISHFINYSNLGEFIDTGYLSYTLDDSVSFVSSSVIPSQINGQELVFSFNNIHSGTSHQLEVEVEQRSTIDTNRHILKTYVDTSGLGAELVDSLVFEEVVRCSYDPNDKNVSPKYRDEGYILNTNELNYLIRFQNTGNDTAYIVTILDQLDSDLDLNSFQLLSSSHIVEVMLDMNTGLVTFTFPDINLTDTITSNDLSQGYVAFKINNKPNLPEGTVIQNQVDIYFDNNAPITTNSTLNTIFDCNSLVESIYLSDTGKFYLEDTLSLCFVDSHYVNSVIWTLNGSQSLSQAAYDTASIFFGSINNYSLNLIVDNDLCILDTTFNIVVNNCVLDTSWALSACDNINIGGVFYDSSQIVLDTIFGINSCDTVNTIYLSIIYTKSDTNHIYSCDSVEFSGVWYYQNNILIDTFSTSTLCDSLLYNVIEIAYTDSLIFDYFGCDSTEYQGVFYYDSDTLRSTINNSNGCITYVQRNVNVYNSVEFEVADTIIQGEFYTLPSGQQIGEPGTYTEVFIDANGCDSSWVVHLFIHGEEVGISEFYQSLLDWNLSPNPARDLVEITFSNECPDCKLTIYDLLGQEVMVLKNITKLIQLNTTSWSSGIYQVMLKDDFGVLLDSKNLLLD